LFKPANLFVATLLGSPEMNLLPAICDGTSYDLGGDGVLNIDFPLSKGRRWEVTIGIRPHDINIHEPEDSGFNATVALVERTGAETVLTCKLPSDRTVCVIAPAQIPIKSGERVGLTFDSARLHRFDTNTGRAL
jgi:multiple sugar transport system ATP-binding protein